MSIGLKADSGGTSGSITINGSDKIIVTSSGNVTASTFTGAVVGNVTGNLTGSLASGGSLTLGTAVSTTSGTAIDFTGIPSWVKRITVMLNRISLSGTDHLLVQIGSGSVTNSGYSSVAGYVVSDTNAASTSSTSGYVIWGGLASQVTSGNVQIILADSSLYIYTSSHSGCDTSGANFKSGGGAVTLSGLLDRVRVTRTGTDTFDAGSVNIIYEG